MFKSRTELGLIVWFYNFDYTTQEAAQLLLELHTIAGTLSAE